MSKRLICLNAIVSLRQRIFDRLSQLKETSPHAIADNELDDVEIKLWQARLDLAEGEAIEPPPEEPHANPTGIHE